MLTKGEKNRIRALSNAARTVRPVLHAAIRRRKCRGATWDQLIDLVNASITEEDEDLVGRLMDQVEAYQALPPETGGLEPRERLHGFSPWLWGLQEGHWSLPERIPRAWWASWVEGYDRSARAEAEDLAYCLAHPYYGQRDGLPNTPWIQFRCDDCRMGLVWIPLPVGYAEAPGILVRSTVCPVCDGRRIAMMTLHTWGKFFPVQEAKEPV
jgi:hypothetical protein